MIQLHQRKRQFSFEAGDAEWGVIELDFLFIVAMGRMIAAKDFDSPVGKTFQDGLAIARRAQRWIHLEPRVVGRPGRQSLIARRGTVNSRAICPPEMFTAGQRGISERKMMRAR